MGWQTNNGKVAKEYADYAKKQADLLAEKQDGLDEIIEVGEFVKGNRINIEKAITDSGVAKTDASAAKTKAEAVEGEFNRVVAEAGSNNPEVVQARGGEVNLGARLNKVTTQLAETVKKSDVLTMANMGQDVKEAMTGGSVAVVGKNSVNAQTIVNKQVGAEKTNFIKIGKNKFNYKTVIVGYYVDQATGVLVADSNFATSDFIYVEPNTKYKKTFGGRPYAFYDNTYTFISGGTSESFTTPSNCTYMRYTIRFPFESSSPSVTIDKLMLVKSTDTLDYEPYYEELENKKPNVKVTTTEIENKAITEELLADGTISASKMKGLVPSGNLLFLDRVIDGKYTYNHEGTLIEAANIEYAYIKVKVNKSTKYSFTSGRFVQDLQNDGKTVIKEAQNVSSVITSPTTEYLAISIKKTDFPLDKYMIVEGDIPKEYIGNLYKIPWLHIPSVATGQNGNANIPIINLPATIPAVVGKELNIYFRNLTNVDLNRYNIDVSCTIGKQNKEKFTVIPTTAETRAITISIYDENGNLLNSATSNIVIKTVSVGSGVNKKFLIIGDSTVRSNGTGDVTQRLLTNFNNDVMDITLLGSMGTSPNVWEGRGGWDAATYRKNTVYDGIVNPFFNSDFDFSYYMNQRGYSDVDYVVLNLGINETFGAQSDSELNSQMVTILKNFDFLVNSIKTFNANIKIGINITIPPKQDQDIFGLVYGNSQTEWRYKRNNVLWVKKMMEHFVSVSNVYLVPIHVTLDTAKNITDAVHPNTAGYNQIGDMIYYWLKSFES